MRILFLGGTQFLGRHVVEAALEHSHEVTLFNRGKTRPELFPAVEKLRGDRDGGLGALEEPIVYCEACWEREFGEAAYVREPAARLRTARSPTGARYEGVCLRLNTPGCAHPNPWRALEGLAAG